MYLFYLKTFHIEWMISSQSAIFLVSLKFLRQVGKFQIVWKVSSLSGKFGDYLKSFRIYTKETEGMWFVHKILKQGTKVPAKGCYLYMCQSWATMLLELKISSYSGSFPTCGKTFQIGWTFFWNWAFQIFWGNFQLMWMFSRCSYQQFPGQEIWEQEKQALQE